MIREAVTGALTKVLTAIQSSSNDSPLQRARRELGTEARAGIGASGAKRRPSASLTKHDGEDEFQVVTPKRFECLPPPPPPLVRLSTKKNKKNCPSEKRIGKESSQLQIYIVKLSCDCLSRQVGGSTSSCWQRLDA